MDLQSRCHPVVAAVAIIGLAATVSAQEPDDELMLGTWLAEGESETECFISDASVTLRVFEKLDPGVYVATYIERGEVRIKDECLERVESDPGDEVPAEIGGGVVFLEVDGGNVTISSEEEGFHAERLKLVGDTMVGTDDMGPITYRKAYSGFRYDAREGAIGWHALTMTACEEEERVLKVVKECANLDAFSSLFREMMEALVREAQKSDKEQVHIKREGELRPLDSFDGKTVAEILDENLPEVASFLTQRISSIRQKLAECDECPEEDVAELQEKLVTRLAQREAMIEVQRARSDNRP